MHTALPQVLQGHFPAGLARIVQASRPGGAVQRPAGKAIQLPPHLAFRTGVPGQPLPGAVLARMEDFFNADFSGVRIHVGQEASSLGALAFTLGSHVYFAPGQYDPQTQRGQRLLGHELTHVVQQRAGRARNPFGSGIAVLQDPLLEAEAERMGLRVSSLPVRGPVQIQQSPARHLPAGRQLQKKPAETVQAYFQIPKSRVFAAPPPRPPQQIYAVVGTGATLPAQVGSDSTNHFRVGVLANVENRTRRPLRVSDDKKMAIEDTDLSRRQAKAFFAAADVIRQGNQELQEAGSTYGIRAVHPQQTLTIVSEGRLWRSNSQLVKVEPYVRATTAALGVGPQNCNEFVTGVTGVGLINDLTILGSGQTVDGAPDWDYRDMVHFAMAEHIGQEMGTTRRTQRTDLSSGGNFSGAFDMLNYGQKVQRIGTNYAHALRRRGAGDLVRRLGVNEWANPLKAGDAFMTHSIADTDHTGRVLDVASGRSFRPKWSYHWAGVVAVSGSDRVTLENYARHDPTGPGGGQDPRWYFQMYGQGEGQTFHDAQVASRGFANPITIAIRNPDRQRTPTLMERAWNRLPSRRAAVIGGVGALAGLGLWFGASRGYIRLPGY